MNLVQAERQPDGRVKVWVHDLDGETLVTATLHPERLERVMSVIRAHVAFEADTIED